MGKYRKHALLLVVLCLQSKFYCRGQNPEETDQHIGPNIITEQNNFKSYFTTGPKFFEYSRSDFDSRLLDCSMKSLLSSYPSSVNLSVFQSPSLTTEDTAQHCNSSDGATSLVALDVLNGTITFSSQDKRFLKQNQPQSKSQYCVRLRTPPFTFVAFSIRHIEDWMTSDTAVEVHVDGEKHTLKVLAQGFVPKSNRSDVVLTVRGLWKKFQKASDKMTLTLSFWAEPWCMRHILKWASPKKGFSPSEVDLVFVLDSSTSVTETSFAQVKQFIVDLISYADIDGGNVRVGVIIFSTNDHVAFYLNSHKTFYDVKNAVNDIRYQHGSTNMTDALRTMRTEVFTQAKGDRPGIPNIAVLITDGISNINSRRTIPEAKKARDERIDIFGIGMGLSYTSELDCIVSKPVEKHRFIVPNATHLQELSAKLFSDFYPGVIETYDWNGRRRYKPFSDYCVTIVPPDRHFIMISFVMMDLQTCTKCQCDVLEIYHTPACTGKPVSRICDSTEALPAAYQADTISVRFKSDGNGEKTGFRMLYSFHGPKDQPRRLMNGRWDCSGARGPMLVMHFICSPDTFCLNAEDNVGACPPAYVCGASTLLTEKRCYRYIQPRRKITPREAFFSCKANKGQLVSLNTEEEWRAVADFWTSATNNRDLIVGLTDASLYRLPDLYWSMWRWADKTIAYYLNISQPSDMVSPPYCAVLQDQERHLTVTSCYSPLEASYLCEIVSGADEDVDSSQQPTVVLPLPTKPASALAHLSECPNGVTTHTFLQCDQLSHCYGDDDHWVQDWLRDNPRLSRTMFQCKDRKQLVQYSFVCDHRPDCSDASDEDACVFPSCFSHEYSCQRSKQCISNHLRCDGIRHCVDRTDEALCAESVSIIKSNTVLPPAIVDFYGKEDIAFTPLSIPSRDLAMPANISHGEPVCPETHFQCPRDGYCLPVYVRCNGVSDCPQGEDEEECSSYTCPGFYRCRGAQNCVHADHMCDGRFQCPRHDDELMCNITCPKNCACMGLAFVCKDRFSANLYPQLKYLDADNSGMNLQDVASNGQLSFLSLQYCGIKEIGKVNLPNLHILDLSYNSLTSFTDEDLGKMKSLQVLLLGFNELVSLNDMYYTDITFPRLSILDMSSGGTREITNTSFLSLPGIQCLNLSGNELHKVEEPGFTTLEDLRDLDISNCPLTEFYGNMFKDLSNLEIIYAPKFEMCCPSILPKGFDLNNCHAPSDEVSSCSALLRTDVFRAFLVIYAFFALGVNFFSFVYRVFGKGSTTKLGFDVFVTHLCVSDFLMGLYLAIVGIADRIYFGTYEWNNTKWKQSVPCQVAGFLSLLSSEVSAFLLCFITLERFLLIRFPHRNLRFTPKSAVIACAVGWVVGVLLAVIPLLPFSPPWDFYSQTGICIPLPITRKVFAGSYYAFLVMIVFNFILFLLIAVGQFIIFWTIRSQARAVRSSGRKTKDMAIARRLLAVVMTDFFCWFPIGLLGLMARSGTPISGDVNVAMAIFVLPFNSALNPFLYTFHMLLERHRAARAKRQSDSERTASSGCPTCAKRKQDQSGDASLVVRADGSVPSATIMEGETVDPEILRLMDRIIEENQMSPERLIFYLSHVIRETN